MSYERETATASNAEIGSGKVGIGLLQRRLSVLLAALGGVVAGEWGGGQGVSPTLVCGSVGKAGIVSSMSTANEQQPEQTGGTPQEQPEQRKAPGRPFQKGDERINRAGRPKKDASEQEMGERLSTLEEMRRVTREPASMDRTDYQRKLRKLYDGEFKTFMGQLTSLEKAEAGKKPPREESGVEEPEHDEGADNARAVLERVLKELSEEARK
jgi:hypothetical protein